MRPALVKRSPEFVAAVEAILPAARVNWDFWHWLDCVEDTFRSAQADDRLSKARIAELQADLKALDRLKGRHGNEAVEHGLWELEVVFRADLDYFQTPRGTSLLTDAVDSLCDIFGWATEQPVSALTPGPKEFQPTPLTGFVALALAEFGEPLGASAVWKRVNHSVRYAREHHDNPRDMVAWV